jgi:trans-aconitate methyltransferase
MKDVNKILPLNTSASVIDYGCGSGGYSYVLAQQFKEVVGVDYFIYTLRRKFIKLSNVRFESADLVTYSGDPKDLLFAPLLLSLFPLKSNRS